METTYSQIAKESRLKVLELVYKAQTSHIGSLFSCADIFAVLFEKMKEEDRFVLSAGWKACMLYYHLWRKGKITTEQLDSYCQEGSEFIGLAEPIIPEISFAGGSMGFGLPASVGFAMAKKMSGEKGRVYCFMSDGEMDIGTTWESALIASHHKLDNLIVFVDYNGYQAMGKTSDVLDLAPLYSKFTSFGWTVLNVIGHDYEQIEKAIDVTAHKPLVIICNTIKGKGVKFMEKNNLYHYKQLSEDEFLDATEDIHANV